MAYKKRDNLETMKNELQTLLTELEKIEDEENFVIEELNKAKMQLDYYTALIRDMKKTLHPYKMKNFVQNL